VLNFTVKTAATDQKGQSDVTLLLEIGDITKMEYSTGIQG
jgi:hypothetical protein